MERRRPELIKLGNKMEWSLCLMKAKRLQRSEQHSTVLISKGQSRGEREREKYLRMELH